MMRRMKSMTGYGRGECAQDGFKVTVELSSVNRKQAEIAVAMPRELELLEAPLREVIHRAVARGRVNVRVSLHPSAAAGPPANISMWPWPRPTRRNWSNWPSN